MSEVIVGRRNERIVVEAFPKGFLDTMNQNLDAIAAEADEVQS